MPTGRSCSTTFNKTCTTRIISRATITTTSTTANYRSQVGIFRLEPGANLCMKTQRNNYFQCSESCGTGGLRRRSLHCIDTRNGQKLDNRFCEGIAHEPVQTECNRTPCPRWAYGPWGECSRSCGGGIRLRHAACQDAAGRELNARMCMDSEKKDSEKCNEQLCTQWQFGPWGQCSVRLLIS